MPTTTANKTLTSSNFVWYKTEAGDHRANLKVGAGWYHLVARKPIGLNSSTWEWDVVYADVGQEDRLVASGESQNWATARAALAAAVDSEVNPDPVVRGRVAGIVCLALLKASDAIQEDIDRIQGNYRDSDFNRLLVRDLLIERKAILDIVSTRSTEIA